MDNPIVEVKRKNVRPNKTLEPCINLFVWLLFLGLICILIFGCTTAVIGLTSDNGLPKWLSTAFYILIIELVVSLILAYTLKLLQDSFKPITEYKIITILKEEKLPGDEIVGDDTMDDNSPSYKKYTDTIKF